MEAIIAIMLPLFITCIVFSYINYVNTETCKHCGSHKTKHIGGNGYNESTFHCRKCGNDFKSNHSFYD